MHKLLNQKISKVQNTPGPYLSQKWIWLKRE